MENVGDQHVELPYNQTIKVHRLMCLELKKFIDRVLQIYSAMESARPRCALGIQALCSLHVVMDKAQQLIQHCSESSKLYLAIIGDRILERCIKIQNDLDLRLGQIQNMVPSLLAAKISGIIEDLRGAKFHLESSEEDAGKIVLALLRQDISSSDSRNNSELEALKLAALKLKITTRVAVLIEKRSIKRLLDKVRDTETRKKKILKYLLYLMRKYGELLGQDQTESNFAQHEEPKCQSSNAEPNVDSALDVTWSDGSSTPEPPVEFKCPISMRLMYDPVIIASGETYERFWIEKWFNEGHETCPTTQMSLENFYVTPNIVMKGLISKWCSKHGITISDPYAQSIAAPVSSQKLCSSESIASFNSSMNDLRLEVSNVSFRSSDTNCASDLLDDDKKVGFSVGLLQMNADICHLAASDRSISLASLFNLASLPWGSQCKAVQDVKEKLNKNEQAYNWRFPNSCMKPLIQFLKDAHYFRDVKAQEDAADVLWAILSKSRIEMLPFDEEVIYELASFLDSAITGKALAIMEVLSCQQFYKSGIVASGILPSILEVLDTEDKELHQLVLKILCNLSCNSDIAYHMVYLECIPKLVTFLDDQSLAGYCLGIINNLCDIEEGQIAVAKTDSFMASIAKLLETGSKQEQDITLEVLQSLCYENAECCQLATGESIIKSLFSISVNGNSKGKVIATELLQLLGHVIEDDVSDCSSIGSTDHPKGKKLLSKAFGHLGRKISRFFRQSH